jgi:hypothetical protein
MMMRLSVLKRQELSVPDHWWRVADGRGKLDFDRILTCRESVAKLSAKLRVANEHIEQLVVFQQHMEVNMSGLESCLNTIDALCKNLRLGPSPHTAGKMVRAWRAEALEQQQNLTAFQHVYTRQAYEKVFLCVQSSLHALVEVYNVV